MGTVITSTAIITDNGYSAIENATLAAQACLEKAGISPQEVGLLINAGVYRDDNIMEPSIASLIQRRLDMGLDFDAGNPQRTTFSFDVVNGACSFLNAVTTADAFLKNGTTRYALIVSGDAHPSKTDHPEFPYHAVGAATLLTASQDPNRGFQAFHYLSNGNDAASSVTAYGDMIAFGDQGRGRGIFEFSDDHWYRLRDLSIQAIDQLLEHTHNPEVDFLLGSDLHDGFCREVCEGSALAKQHTRALELFRHHGGDVHTAAPIAAYVQLEKELGEGHSKTLLFTSVGSGDACACALYRQ